MSLTRSAPSSANVDLASLPAAIVIQVNGPLIVVSCPFCQGRHGHGWRIGIDVTPTRLAHCRPFGRRYRLEAQLQAGAA